MNPTHFHPYKPPAFHRKERGRTLVKKRKKKKLPTNTSGREEKKILSIPIPRLWLSLLVHGHLRTGRETHVHMWGIFLERVYYLLNHLSLRGFWLCICSVIVKTLEFMCRIHDCNVLTFFLFGHYLSNSHKKIKFNFCLIDG